MSDLIDREDAVALIEAKQKEICPLGNWSRHAVYGTDREKFDAWQEIIDGLDAIKTVDAVPAEAYKQTAWERDVAIKQLREDYGVAFGEKRHEDFVPVVRCGKCQHSRERNEDEKKYLVEGVLICTSCDAADDGWNPVWSEHFCSYGKQKKITNM